MDDRHFQFEWDQTKAAANARKHGVSFELACIVFNDSRLLTVADIAHGGSEERWFSIGWAGNGAMLAVVYRWSEIDPATTEIRLISARRATAVEMKQYEKIHE